MEHKKALKKFLSSKKSQSDLLVNAIEAKRETRQQARNVLDSISSPKDIKKLGMEELNFLAQEIREKILEVVSKNGGHLH